jgi:broad specificity phosphatase PhoE
MKLIIVRHAETVANVKRLDQGVGPGILTRNGVAQARRTAEFLKAHEIDFIYSSDLKRAKDTIAEIKKEVKAPVRFVKELRERALGDFEDQPYGSIKRFVKENNLDYITYKPNKGESIKEAFARIWDFYKRCALSHKEDTILWMSHGGMIRRVLMHVMKADAARHKELHPDNCAVSIIEIDPHYKSKVTLINYTAHLAERDCGKESNAPGPRVKRKMRPVAQNKSRVKKKN